MVEFRREPDSLGAVEVPWGAQTRHSLVSFSIGRLAWLGVGRFETCSAARDA